MGRAFGNWVVRMPGSRSLTMSVEVPLGPPQAFDLVMAGVEDSLSRQGSSWFSGPDGRILQDGIEIGRVTAWVPGERVRLDWRPTTWQHNENATVEIRFEGVGDGSRVVVELRGWEGAFRGDSSDLAGWFGGAALSGLLKAFSPRGFGDWLTDRKVRRPTGPWARETYGNPLFHIPNFLLILDRIRLGPDDSLLEVGCGGGAFLRRALESGCRATAIDHSPEMVRLAAEQNRAAVEAGRLVVLQSEAYPLPVADDSFTCSVMTGVIGFLPDPVAALREIRRALRPGGRVAIFGGTAALRGTPAAPEPFASRIRFYDVAEFERLGREAGFSDVRVEEPDLEGYARTAQIPEEAMPLFRGKSGALLLMARKG